MKPLPRSFYLRPAMQVARDLLGKYIIHSLEKKYLIGRIVEVEAYGKNDPASHSFNGRTNRNDVMFWDGGHLYVYFTYGMHFCANVVTGRKGIGEAVLIRAVEPMVGIDIMAKNRYSNPRLTTHQSLINLTNGPAKFCDAFRIAQSENGLNLISSNIIIIRGEPISPRSIGRSSRIGVHVGVEKKWRFFLNGNPWVSR